MPRDAKASRQLWLGQAAPGKLENLLAHPALKMVMMAFARSFVARGQAGQVYRDKRAFLDHRSDVAVHRCNAQPGRGLACLFQGFHGRKRAARLKKSRRDGFLLPCIPWGDQWALCHLFNFANDNRIATKYDRRKRRTYPDVPMQDCSETACFVKSGLLRT